MKKCVGSNIKEEEEEEEGIKPRNNFVLETGDDKVSDVMSEQQAKRRP